MTWLPSPQAVTALPLSSAAERIWSTQLYLSPPLPFTAQPSTFPATLLKLLSAVGLREKSSQSPCRGATFSWVGIPGAALCKPSQWSYHHQPLPSEGGSSVRWAEL